MNRIANRALLVVIVCLMAAGCKKAATPLNVTVPANFVAHSGGGATIKTPPTWKDKGAGSGHVVLQVVADDNIANVNLVVVDGEPPTRDPAEVGRQVVKQVSGQIQNISLKSSESILVAGEDSPRIIYDGSMMGVQLRWQQTMVAKGGKTYILTYTAPVGTYDKNAATVDQILASLTINR